MVPDSSFHYLLYTCLLYTSIVRCASLSESILKLLQKLKAGDELITCTQNGTIARIRPDDVYYFESVDNKTFLYTEKEVYEIRQKLYEIEDSYAGLDFFRSSKSIIVNLSKIRYLSPVLGSRLEATPVSYTHLFRSISVPYVR